MEPVPTDPRVDFIGNIVVKTMKLKPEKWMRLMATEDYKKVVLDFLDTDKTNLLIIVQVGYYYMNTIQLSLNLF